MPWRRGIVLASWLALFTPERVDARADDRVFDPYFWSHPRYIDPTYHFTSPGKGSRDEAPPEEARRTEREKPTGEPRGGEGGRRRR